MNPDDNPSVPLLSPSLPAPDLPDVKVMPAPAVGGSLPNGRQPGEAVPTAHASPMHDMPPAQDAAAPEPPPAAPVQTAEESRPVKELVLPLDTPPIEVETEVDAPTLAQLLAHTEAVWTALGDSEPHWSVISAERFRQREFDAHRDEFYASGRDDLRTFEAFLARNGVALSRLQRVLEYGCGVGRVTRYLAERFAAVEACDISPTHLAQAGEHLARSGLSNVQWRRVRALDDIGTAADTDAVFCVIVLQHNPPPVMAAILRRLLGRLRTGGIAYVQLPTHAAGYRFSVADYLAHGVGGRHIEMHYLPQRRVFEIAHEAGCGVLEVREDDWVGRREVELSNTFLLQRREG